MNGAIIVAVIIFGHFLPSAIAVANKKKNKSSIIVVNVFLGWTLIGWVVALAWSLSKDNDVSHVVTHKHDHDITDKLEKLANLKEKGVITEEEFVEEKKKILSK